MKTGVDAIVIVIGTASPVHFDLLAAEKVPVNVLCLPVLRGSVGADRADPGRRG